jgi:hypothetical protein
MDDDANLIEINLGADDGSGVERRVNSKTSSKLLIDRYDARGLLDEFSLSQLSTGIDLVSVNNRAYSSSFDEDVSGEEANARNIVRYEGLNDFMGTKSNDMSKDGERNLTIIDSGSLDSNHEKENPFQLSEEQSKGIPSGIQLVSSKHSCVLFNPAAMDMHFI